MSVGENFFSFTQIVLGAERLGLFPGGHSRHDTCWRDECGAFDVKDVVGPLTGLDMSKYDLVQSVNLLGWHLVRKA